MAGLVELKEWLWGMEDEEEPEKEGHEGAQGIDGGNSFV